MRLHRRGTLNELPVCFCRYLARNEDQAIGFDGLRVRSDGCSLSMTLQCGGDRALLYSRVTPLEVKTGCIALREG